MSSNIATTARALHWVLKIADRKATVAFLRQVLGMRTLRHEEFEKGCDAACNGPYDGRWSKTMIGYGGEDNHFVLELTYNYEVASYDYRHDFRGITIDSRTIAERVKNSGYKFETIKLNNDSKPCLKLLSPDGYPFYICEPGADDISKDPVTQISLTVSNVEKSFEFWGNRLGFRVIDKSDERVSFRCDGVTLELVKGHVDHGTAFGRIAFSCPRNSLSPIENSVKSSGSGNVITPLISLDTPGKATVQVVILGDPDGYEICFVGDEAFRQLSQIDETADRLLDDAMNKDKSAEWFKKKGLTKKQAGDGQK